MSKDYTKTTPAEMRPPILMKESNFTQIAKVAREEPTYIFTSIVHKIDVYQLREAFRQLRKDAASGVDKVTAKEYAKELIVNLYKLQEQLQTGTYKPQPVNRIWIEKDNGKKRPLGIPSLEDKIVQKAVTNLMNAIYEVDFKENSYGFREERGAHMAIRIIRELCLMLNIGYILDADVSAYFDSINHDKLIEMIKTRLNDGGLIRLIKQWLKAGIMENGQYSKSEQGTPQGGIISPLLSNIYLHNVLDEWFENVVKPRMMGRCFIVRYADDFVLGFEYKEDAERVMEVLPKRFAKYELTIHPEKTKLVTFKRPIALKKEEENGTFDFLGFTHYWSRTRNGRWTIKRKTKKKSLKKIIKSADEWIKSNRHRSIWEIIQKLKEKLRGHYQYFGVRCNTGMLDKVLRAIERKLRYWLSRRSKKGITWDKMRRILARYSLPQPCMTQKNV